MRVLRQIIKLKLIELLPEISIERHHRDDKNRLLCINISPTLGYANKALTGRDVPLDYEDRPYDGYRSGRIKLKKKKIIIFFIRILFSRTAWKYFRLKGEIEKKKKTIIT